ncbi:MAG: SDR family oxidoreductase [Planctomycetes bacterium]|nr:SDR family oxidoreductase [Planctomycetota bacterium]
MRLKDKVAIITGAGSGIGQASAISFAREGARVTVADYNIKGAEETAKKINTEIGKKVAMAFKVDVSKEDQVDNMVKQTVQEFGTVDILVNNAGINEFIPFPLVQPDDVKKIMDVNFMGAFLCVKAVLPLMTEKMYGKIVNVTSVMSVIAGKGQAAYNASKGALKMLTQAMAVDLGCYNININAVGPGMTRTTLTKQLFSNPDRVKWFEEKIPLGRLGDPEDIAAAILFLASDEAKYITGETIFVDGGMIATR